MRAIVKKVNNLPALIDIVDEDKGAVYMHSPRSMHISPQWFKVMGICKNLVDFL